MTSKISLQSHPEIKVITSTKFRNKNELKSPEQLLHKRRRDSSSSTTSSSSSSTSSSSSESSLSEGDYADSSIQFCDLCSTDRTLLTIVSIPTSRKHGGEYYHVVNNVTEETIDIEKYDRIIRINSNDVKNIDPVEFRDILQTELSSSKCFKFRKRTSMTLWRWSGEDISEICVQFSFETKKQVSISTISSQPTREHGKLKKQNRSAIKKLIKVEAKTGTFVRFQPDTGTLIGATINKDDFKFYLFNFQFYSCTVRWSKQTVTREVCTISCQADDQAYDVVGDFDTKELILRPQQPISIEHPDERFFIYYEIGETGDKVFELLLYPNQCIKYSSAKQCLELEELGMSKSKSKRSFINPKTQFQFEPQTSLEETEVRKYVKSHKYGLCCFSSTEENNQGPYLDGIKPCNEFKLKSEEDVKTELSMESGNGDEIDACISITSLTRDI